jgi:anti-anti-sigma regulatory factor
MLRISQDGATDRSVGLKLEGRVVGPWVGELRRICEPLLGGDRGLTLDLAEVSYVDAEGAATLESFRSRGARLERCSPFVAQQIKVAGMERNRNVGGD